MHYVGNLPRTNLRYVVPPCIAQKITKLKMKLRISTFLELIFVLLFIFHAQYNCTLQNIIWLENRKGFNSFRIVRGSTNICNYWRRDLYNRISIQIFI